LSKHKRIDLSGVKTIKAETRPTKSDITKFGTVFEPDMPFDKFLESLPEYLKATDLLEFAGRIAESKRDGKSVVWMMGAHPIKVGLTPIIIDLIRNEFISHLAVNGACMIHDLEIAYFGRTSEGVGDGLADGRFAMVAETPALIFKAIERSKAKDAGLGEAISTLLADDSPKHVSYSLFKCCHDMNIPVTVHLAFGTDTISQHPGFNGAVMGALTHNDFLILSESLKNLMGGAVVNFGSAVILPEVFLKALTVSRNIHGKIDNFFAANFDMIQHYRPNINVVSRPVADAGKGFSFTGHHELMLPILAAAIKAKYKELKENK